MMIKYAEMAKNLIVFVKNGVMSHLATKKALMDLFAIQPNLVASVKHKTSLVLELSRGIRTMLCWYREFKKGTYKRSLLKHATPTQEAPKGRIPKSQHRTQLPLSFMIEYRRLYIFHPKPQNISKVQEPSAHFLPLHFLPFQALVESVVKDLILSNSDESNVETTHAKPEDGDEWADDLKLEDVKEEEAGETQVQASNLQRFPI